TSPLVLPSLTFRPQLRRASSVASASMRVSWSEDLLRMSAVDVEDVVLVGGAGDNKETTISQSARATPTHPAPPTNTTSSTSTALILNGSTRDVVLCCEEHGVYELRGNAELSNAISAGPVALQRFIDSGELEETTPSCTTAIFHIRSKTCIATATETTATTTAAATTASTTTPTTNATAASTTTDATAASTTDATSASATDATTASTTTNATAAASTTTDATAASTTTYATTTTTDATTAASTTDATSASTTDATTASTTTTNATTASTTTATSAAATTATEAAGCSSQDKKIFGLLAVVVRYIRTAARHGHEVLSTHAIWTSYLNINVQEQININIETPGGALPPLMGDQDLRRLQMDSDLRNLNNPMMPRPLMDEDMRAPQGFDRDMRTGGGDMDLRGPPGGLPPQQPLPPPLMGSQFDSDFRQQNSGFPPHRSPVSPHHSEEENPVHRQQDPWGPGPRKRRWGDPCSRG
ncbi:hypothetical protein L9F63_027988, partial [Diploptera punctata]